MVRRGGKEERGKGELSMSFILVAVKERRESRQRGGRASLRREVRVTKRGRRVPVIGRHE